MSDIKWRVSSFTDDNSCVEVAEDSDSILVRNSNRPDDGTLTFTRAEFGAWLKGCRAGEFDDLA